MTPSIRSDFDMLRPYEKRLWRLGAVDEQYLHACLRYMEREFMTNTSLTNRSCHW
ncbi:hypothetical protein [Rhodoferax antarcticus]|uniref:hypothetical protein n=1 Tax=Rhodoferax antarcticus TaxID=81479 RepID=UPI002224AA7F|nr:hypothetical protein [Rhodoferax antarcticus]MCW2311019.1 hypothetical protein [Rhodoferax antarcticus]